MILKRVLPLVFLLQAVYCPLCLCDDEMPKPDGWVNDYAGVISQEYRDRLTAIIEELREKTTAEIFIVTVRSIAPYDESGYARLLFDSWKPGQKGKDNGVLVLLAVKERRWRIETGYGVEGILPDGLCGEIGRNYMVTSFKAADYGKGLYDGAAIIASTIARDSGVALDSLSGINIKPSGNSSGSRKKDAFGNIFLFFIVAAALAPFLISLPLMAISSIIIFYLFGTIMTSFFIILYAIILLMRFSGWCRIPRTKRRSFFTYAGSGDGGGWGSGGFGGGGFGGGGGGGGGGGF